MTSKVVEEEQSKRHHQGIFEFGIPSPVFLPITTAAIINLIAFLSGITQAWRQRSIEDVFIQMLLAGFGVVNNWPVYEDVFIQMLLAGFGVVNNWPVYEGMVLRS